MKIYLATTLRDLSQQPTLDKLGKRERLLSYVDIHKTRQITIVHEFYKKMTK